MALITPFKKAKVWGETYTYEQTEKKMKKEKRDKMQKDINKGIKTTEKFLADTSKGVRKGLKQNFGIKGW